MKCPRCGESMSRMEDETHDEFMYRWETAECCELDRGET